MRRWAGLMGLGILPLVAACGPDGSTPTLPVYSDPSTALSQGFSAIASLTDAAARRWRDSDPRYGVQETSWNFGSGPLYQSYSISTTRAHYAHAAGLTGAGQVIGFVDSGYRTSHEVFDGKNVEVVGDITQDGHGTMAVSVAAGDTGHMIGIAPGADVMIGSYDSELLMAGLMNRARVVGAVAVNNSWGYVTSGGKTLVVSAANFNASFGSGDGASYYNALSSYAQNGVVVFSAANRDGDTRSGLTEALPHLRPELESGWLAGINVVPTLDSGGTITGGTLISAACMEAARWCLAADGAWEGAWDTSDTAYEFNTGTSFVAPQISGALALLAEAFPALTPHQLRQRLIAAADNGWIGEFDGLIDFGNGITHGYNWTFGNGFLDIEAALRPIGKATATMSDGTVVTMGAPLIQSGAAYGDAVTAALSDHRIEVSDAMGAGFAATAAALVGRHAPSARMATASARMFDEGLAQTRAADRDPLRMGAGASLLAAYVGQIEQSGTGAADFVTLTPGPRGGDTLGLSVLGHADVAGGDLGLGLTLVQGQGGPLALGRAGAVSTAAALDLRFDRATPLGDLGISAQWGLATASGTTGFEALSPAAFSRIGADLGWRSTLTRGDRLVLGAGLPLAVTGGQGVLALPVAQPAISGWTYQDVTLPLAPAARQVDLSLSYMVPLAGGAELALGAYRSVNAGHVGGAAEWGAMLGWQIGF